MPSISITARCAAVDRPTVTHCYGRYYHLALEHGELLRQPSPLGGKGILQRNRCRPDLGAKPQRAFRAWCDRLTVPQAKPVFTVLADLLQLRRL